MRMPCVVVKDLRDESGDSNLYVKTGTKIVAIADEEDHLICELPDKSVSFPVDYDEIRPAVVPAEQPKGANAEKWCLYDAAGGLVSIIPHYGWTFLVKSCFHLPVAKVQIRRAAPGPQIIAE
jgi:hypothetical protein